MPPKRLYRGGQPVQPRSVKQIFEENPAWEGSLPAGYGKWVEPQSFSFPINYKLTHALANMKKLIAKHKDSVIRFTNLDYDRIENVTYLYEFDRAVQCETWGYPTEDAYYRDASTSDAVMAIRVPYFAISAADDPIAVDEAVPYEEIKQNPYTVLCSTSLGGHLSWFEIGGGRWHAKPVCGNFCC